MLAPCGQSRDQLHIAAVVVVYLVLAKFKSCHAAPLYLPFLSSIPAHCRSLASATNGNPP